MCVEERVGACQFSRSVCREASQPLHVQPLQVDSTCLDCGWVLACRGPSEVKDAQHLVLGLELCQCAGDEPWLLAGLRHPLRVLRLPEVVLPRRDSRTTCGAAPCAE